MRIHETTEPIIPGKAAPAFSANLANKFFNASNLFLIHEGSGFGGVGFGGVGFGGTRFYTTFWQKINNSKI